jgi:hypothetical protein
MGNVAPDEGTDPATQLRVTGTPTPTAVASTLAVTDLPSPISQFVGFVALFLLFAPLIVGVILLCPICAIINELSYIIPGVSPVGALSAATEAPVVETPTLVAATRTEEPADPAPVTSTVKPTHRGTAKKAETKAAKEPKSVDDSESPAVVESSKFEQGPIRGARHDTADKRTTRAAAAVRGEETAAAAGSESNTPSPAHPKKKKAHRAAADDS